VIGPARDTLALAVSGPEKTAPKAGISARSRRFCCLLVFAGSWKVATSFGPVWGRFLAGFGPLLARSGRYLPRGADRNLCDRRRQLRGLTFRPTWAPQAGAMGVGEGSAGQDLVQNHVQEKQYTTPQKLPQTFPQTLPNPPKTPPKPAHGRF
jgi:hypothetical protein